MTPVLDSDRCNGTGDCIRICPVQCLERWGHSVWLARPQDCLSCGACAAVCPTGAIRIPDFGSPSAPSALPGDPECR